jgi:tetratricopeptide (TPR) repeat protein
MNKRLISLSLATFILLNSVTCKAADMSADIAEQLINEGILLSKEYKNQDAIARFDEVIIELKSSSEPNTQAEVASALVNKSLVLNNMGRQKDAIAIADDAINHFGSSSEPALQEHIAKAYFSKGASTFMETSNLGRHASDSDYIKILIHAINSFDIVTVRFGESKIPAIQVSVAKALNYKGAAFSQLHNPKKAIENYDEVIKKFSLSTDPFLLEQLVTAMLYKGFAFEELGQKPEALTCMDQVINKFDKSTNQEIRRQVQTAHNFKEYITENN